MALIHWNVLKRLLIKILANLSNFAQYSYSHLKYYAENLFIYVYEYDIIIECEFELQNQKIEGGTLQKTAISIFANSFHFWMFWKQNLHYS